MDLGTVPVSRKGTRTLMNISNSPNFTAVNGRGRMWMPGFVLPTSSLLANNCSPIQGVIKKAEKGKYVWWWRVEHSIEFDHYYELGIRVLLLHKLCWALTCQVMVFGDGAFSRQLGLNERPWADGISDLTPESLGSLPCEETVRRGWPTIQENRSPQNLTMLVPCS